MSIQSVAQEIVDLNRRVADSTQAELLPANEPEDPDSRRRRACRAARHLTRFTLARSADARNVWQSVQEVLSDGAARDDARSLLLVARTSIESWLELAGKGRAVWQGVAAETGATPEGLDDLAAEERSVIALRATVQRVLDFLASDRPPVDLARLQQGREEMARGNFKRPDEMRALFPTPRK